MLNLRKIAGIFLTLGNLPPGIANRLNLRKFALHENWQNLLPEVQLRIAMSSSTSPMILEEMGLQSSSSGTRAAVARNSYTSPDTLIKMNLQETDPEVLRALTENINFPAIQETPALSPLTEYWGPEGPPPGITNAVRLNIRKTTQESPEESPEDRNIPMFPDSDSGWRAAHEYVVPYFRDIYDFGGSEGPRDTSIIGGTPPEKTTVVDIAEEFEIAEEDVEWYMEHPEKLPDAICGDLTEKFVLPPKSYISMSSVLHLLQIPEGYGDFIIHDKDNQYNIIFDEDYNYLQYNAIIDNVDNALLPGGIFDLADASQPAHKYENREENPILSAIDSLIHRYGYTKIYESIDYLMDRYPPAEGEPMPYPRYQVILQKPEGPPGITNAVRLNMRKKAMCINIPTFQYLAEQAGIDLSNTDPEVLNEVIHIGIFGSCLDSSDQELLFDPQLRELATQIIKIVITKFDLSSFDTFGNVELNKMFNVLQPLVDAFIARQEIVRNTLEYKQHYEEYHKELQFPTDPETGYITGRSTLQNSEYLDQIKRRWESPPGITNAVRLNMRKKALEIGGAEFPDALKFKEETTSPLDVETNVQELYRDAESFIVNYIWSGLAAEGITSPDDTNIIQTDVDKIQFSSASSLVNQLMQEGWFTYLELSYNTKLRADPQLQQQIFNSIQNAIIEGVV